MIEIRITHVDRVHPWLWELISDTIPVSRYNRGHWYEYAPDETTALVQALTAKSKILEEYWNERQQELF